MSIVPGQDQYEKSLEVNSKPKIKTYKVVLLCQETWVWKGVIEVKQDLERFVLVLKTGKTIEIYPDGDTVIVEEE